MFRDKFYHQLPINPTTPIHTLFPLLFLYDFISSFFFFFSLPISS